MRIISVCSATSFSLLTVTAICHNESKYFLEGLFPSSPALPSNIPLPEHTGCVGWTTSLLTPDGRYELGLFFLP